MISTIEFLVVCEVTDNLFDLRDRESDDDREVFDTGGVPAKGALTVKSVNMVLEDPRGDAKHSPRDYGAKEDVTVTGRLWRGGGCSQGLLGLPRYWNPRVR